MAAQCLPSTDQAAENGFLQKIKERMHPARPQAIQVAVKGGTPFLCVEASRRKGELPWEEIAFCAGAALGECCCRTESFLQTVARSKRFCQMRLPH